jgi:hypothetical protein
MNLGQIRQKFVEISGRYDLVTNPSTFIDNGANTYITEGLKWLDRLLNKGHMQAKCFKSVVIGDWYVLLQNCRAIQKVWCSNTEEKWELPIVTLEDFKSEYAEPMANADQGQPQYATIGILRTSPETVTQITIDSFCGTANTSAVSEYSYSSLLFSPPADGSYELEVNGLFYSTSLSTDADENWWTVNFPLVVVWAALRQIEITYRNYEGQKDWENAISKELDGVIKDSIEEEIADFDQIGG